MKQIYALVLFFLVYTYGFGQDWKSAAEAAIRTHRMAPATIFVKNAQGEAVPGAKVHLKMRNHRFKWGTTVNVGLFSQLEQQGFDPGGDHPFFLQLRYFNSVTPENAGKWKGWINPTTRSRYLRITDWLNTLGIENRGHTTIWPSISRWNAVPDTLLNAQAILNTEGIEIKSKLEVMRDIIKGHIEKQLPVLAEKGVYERDLVNELVHENEIVRDLMQLPAAQHAAEHTQWYQWAKAAAPEVKLVANEYDLFQSGNNFHIRFADYIRTMISLGAPIDAVGMQGHFFSTIPDYPELKKRLGEVAVLGLPMSLTEFDMVHNTYAEMERVLYAIFSEPLVEGFSFWGAWDGSQWRNNSAMFNLGWRLKPSGQAWIDLVKKQWWTDTTQVVEQSGQFATDAFLGSYDIFVEYEGKAVSRSLELDKNGAEITINIDSAAYPAPQAQLEVAGDPVEVFLNEPMELSIASVDTIVQVTYYDGDRILAIQDQPPYNYSFTVVDQPILKLSAEVRFHQGYRLRTPAKLVAVNISNSRPRLGTVSPPSGSNLLAQDTVPVYITATDPDQDPIRISLIDDQGMLVQEGLGSPLKFDLTGLQPGAHHFILRVEDDKFGSDELPYLINLVEDEVAGTLAASPFETNDDIEENPENRGIDLSGDLDLGEKITGIRFPLVGLSPGAVIDSAFLQFTNQKPNQTGACTVRIQGEKMINPIPFTGAQGNLSERIRTAAGVSWTMPDWIELDQQLSGQKSPDLSDILIELISQPGWTEQSPIHLLIDPESGPSKRSAYSYDLSESQAPLLQIHYTLDISAQPPPAPAGFSFTPIGEQSGLLNWETPQPSETIWGYRLFVDGIELPELLPGNQFSIGNLEKDRIYTVQAQTLGRYGIWSARSEVFSFSLSGTTGINDPSKAISGVSWYPNPVRDQLHFRFEDPSLQQLNVQLFDMHGRHGIKTRTVNTDEMLDVSGLPAGMYWLRLSDQEGHYQYLKLIKQ